MNGLLDKEWPDGSRYKRCIGCGTNYAHSTTHIPYSAECAEAHIEKILSQSD